MVAISAGRPATEPEDRVLRFGSETSQFQDIFLVSESILKKLVSNYGENYMTGSKVLVNFNPGLTSRAWYFMILVT